MLTRWKLSNFKSIGQPVELELGPLTLIAGVNSAGKSSLIQSILMIAQTLASRDPGVGLVLDGGLVSLGTALDVWNSGNERSSLQIEFDLEPNHGLTSNVAAKARTIGVATAFVLQQHGATKAPPDLRLWWTQVQVTGDEGLSGTGVEPAERERFGAALRFTADDLRTTSVIVPSSGYRVSFESRSVSREWESQMLAQAWARQQAGLPRLSDNRIGTAQFLPRTVLVSVNPSEKAGALRMERYLEPLRRDVPSPTKGEREGILHDVSSPREEERDRIPDWVTQEVGRITGRLGPDVAIELRDYRDYINLTHRLTPRQRRLLYKELSDSPRRWIAEGTSHSSKAGWDTEEPLPGSIQHAVTEIRELFVDKLAYIGALRHAPQVLWSSNGNETWRVVGTHGERLAQALHKYDGTRVHYWHPQENAPANASLNTALRDWLGYLAMIDAVTTHDLGKLGYQLELKDAEVPRPLDLTSVGLGVSQVLPILVAGLLMPPGGVLIVEQPEVHLHPQAQSRLGDFFLGLARTGRQAIIETHSEHIANRLFLRMAESDSEIDNVASMVKVYFAERRKGQTTFLRVKPNRYGIVEDWPSGFFDEGALEAQAMLEASMRLRMQDRGRNRGT
jgi:predicted ATPase